MLLESTTQEVQILLDGLAKSVTGQAEAVRALPSSAPDLHRDLAVLAVFSLAFFVFNWGVRLLMEPLVKKLFGMRAGKANKFCQSAMEAIFYGGFAIIGAPIVLSQEWVWPSTRWWSGFAEGEHVAMRADLRCYYLMYIARYLQLTVSVLLEPIRKDFVAMFVHHVVTTTGCYMTYINGWNHVGAVTMLLFDPADVPLHLAKMCNYAAEATRVRAWKFSADRLFEVFAVLFFVTRIPMFSFILYSATIEGPQYLPSLTVGFFVTLALAYTILVLQVYWFGLIVQLAIKLLKGAAEVKDSRSDSETEAVSSSARKVAVKKVQ